MTLREIQALLDFHYWARNRVFEAVQDLTPEQFTRPHKRIARNAELPC